LEKVIGTSKITRRFQITLTKNIREKLDINKSEGLIIFIEKDREIIIRKST